MEYKNTSDLLEQKQKIIKIQKIINDKDELIKYLKAKNDELTKEIELLRKGKNVIESKKTGILQINKNNKKYPKKYKKKIRYPKDENVDEGCEDDNDSD